MENKKLECKDCKYEFIFTVNEQEFYKSKDFSDPIRCPDCRQRKKESRNNNKK